MSELVLLRDEELKMQLEALRKEFESKRNDIQNAYRTKIKALREASFSSFLIFRAQSVE